MRKKILAAVLAAGMLLTGAVPALAGDLLISGTLPKGASFEYVENISFKYEGYDHPEKNSFYLYSPSTPHNFDLLSSFMNGAIFVYPDKPYASWEEALKALQNAGLIEIAESCPAHIVVACPANGQSWSQADVDMYYLYMYYLAGGYFDILNGIGENPMDTEFPRRTMHTLQYVVAEGSGATFVNNYLSQHAGRIAGQVLFGGEIDKNIKKGYAVPSYLANPSPDALAYWKAANETDSEPSPGVFVNSSYVQKKVITFKGGNSFDREVISKAWAELLSRSTRLCVTANLVLRSCEFGDWVLMSWPNYGELGIERYSYVFENGVATPYTEYKSVPNCVHTLVPESVRENPDKPAPLVIVLHGMSDDPLNVVNGCGWADKAAQEDFIVVSPDREDADYLIEVIEYTKKLYNIDTSRIYVTGFSMGGMNSAVAGYAHTDVFAAMAPMGATGSNMLPDSHGGAYSGRMKDSTAYDIPACVIVGSIDDSNVRTVDGVPVIAGIEEGALELIFQFNNIYPGKKDYEAAPLWGYKPNNSYVLKDKNQEWVVNEFYKEGYSTPFIELVTFVGAGHANSDYMAEIAWNFLSRYSRASDGSVVDGELPFLDCSPSDWFYGAVTGVHEEGLLVGRGGKRFDPQAGITIAEALTAVYRLGYGQGHFDRKETTGSNWQEAANYLLDALKLEFGDINAPITRGEMAAVTAAYLRHTGLKYQEVEKVQFTDIYGHKYAEDIQWLQSVGGINGYAEKDGTFTFRPESGIKRCEAAQMLANLLISVKPA
jgi:hypothetical protein